MIVFNNEEDIIDYLMTTEFESEELTAENSKLLLNKFRYYCRKFHAETKQKMHEIERLEKKIISCENKLEILEKEVEISDVRYDRLKKKKLSFKERIKGKIFT